MISAMGLNYCFLLFFGRHSCGRSLEVPVPCTTGIQKTTGYASGEERVPLQRDLKSILEFHQQPPGPFGSLSDALKGIPSTCEASA